MVTACIKFQLKRAYRKFQGHLDKNSYLVNAKNLQEILDQCSMELFDQAINHNCLKKKFNKLLNDVKVETLH